MYFQGFCKGAKSGFLLWMLSSNLVFSISKNSHKEDLIWMWLSKISPWKRPYMSRWMLLSLYSWVCRQLGIVTYHPEILTTPQPSEPAGNKECRVPTVKVCLVKGIKLPPRPGQSVIAEVSWDGEGPTGPLLLEANPELLAQHGVQVSDGLVPSAEAGTAKIIVTNCSGFTYRLEEGTDVVGGGGGFG